MKTLKLFLIISLFLFCLNAQGQNLKDDLELAKDYFQKEHYSDALFHCEYYLEHTDMSNKDAKVLKRKIDSCQRLEHEIDSLIEKSSCKYAKNKWDELLKINPTAIKQKEKVNNCRPQNVVFTSNTKQEAEQAKVKNSQTTIIDNHPTNIEQMGGVNIGIVNGGVININPLDTKPVSDNINNPKCSYLPFGVHQFVNKQYGKGILFAGTQIGLSLAGVSLLQDYQDTKCKYLNEPYQSDSRHRTLKNRYDWQLAGSVACFIGAAAMIWWNYCDNFNRNFCLKPIAMLDEYGKPQMGIYLSFNF